MTPDEEEGFRHFMRSHGAPDEWIEAELADLRVHRPVTEEDRALAAWLLEDWAAHVPTSFNAAGGYEFDPEALRRYMDSWGQEEEEDDEDDDLDPERN